MAQQLGLHLLARQAIAAGHAAHPIQAAVQIDDVAAAGGLVQPVDVLRHQGLEAILALQLHQSPMRVVGVRAAEVAPANETARPVSLPRQLLVHERAKHHRAGALPGALRVAVIGNSGLGAAAGAGQNEQPLGTIQKTPQTVLLHHTSVRILRAISRHIRT